MFDFRYVLFLPRVINNIDLQIALFFSAEQCNLFHMHKTLAGGIDLEIKFASQTTKTLTCVCMGMYDAVCHLTKDSRAIVKM